MFFEKSSITRFFVTTVLTVREVTAIWSPEQVSIAFGGTSKDGMTTSMQVQWVITSDSEEINGAPFRPQDSLIEYWEPLAEELDDKKIGNVEKITILTNNGTRFSMTDPGLLKRNYTFHKNILTGLKPGTVYNYHVGNYVDGWSTVYSFTTVNNQLLKQTYFIYGDLGTRNDQVIGHLAETMIRSQGTDDAITGTFHIGDMAYDLIDDFGRRGDLFMNEIEPISAALPYMTCHGNHEAHYDFLHYTYRFNHMPSNSPPLNFPGFNQNYPTLSNNWYYSYEISNVHYVMLSAESYANYMNGDRKYGAVLQKQYDWLIKDLESVDRSRIHFVIVMAHRNIYCSTIDDWCSQSFDNAMRVGVYDNNSFKYGLEEVFHKYKVDMFFAGHEHNYERLGAVYNNTEVTPWEGGNHTMRNPGATVYIVTGAPGNREVHGPFDKHPLPFSTFRSELYSYGKLTIFNKTHLYFEQIASDFSSPSTVGKVIDYMWLIKDN